MDANERLNNAQSALTQRGVRDVKFFFDPQAGSALPSDVKNDAANVLDSFLRGEAKAMPSFSDAAQHK